MAGHYKTVMAVLDTAILESSPVMTRYKPVMAVLDTAILERTLKITGSSR